MGKILFIPSWFPAFGARGGEYFIDLFELYQSNFPGSRMLYINLKRNQMFGEKYIRFFANFRLVKIALIKLQLKYLKVHGLQNDKLLIEIPTIFGYSEKDDYYLHLSLAYQYFFRKEFSDFKFISAQSVEYAGLVAFHLQKKFGDLSYTITEHNYFSSGRFSKDLWPGVRAAFKGASNVYFCSHDKMRQVLATGVELDIKKRHVNYNYVKTTEYLISNYEPLNVLRIITVASASHFKDLPTLFATLDKLLRMNVDYKFTLVGFGSWGNSEKYLSENFICENRHRFNLIPHLDHTDLILEYQKNDLFLLTSLAEGMPVSLLEAMELGLMAVVTKHGGSEEVVLDGVNGYSANVSDSKQLSEFIRNIYQGNMKHIPELNKRRAHSFCSADAYELRTFLKL